MKRRLFWKILIGFWVTSIIITQGIWLSFTILRPAQQPNDTLSVMGRVVMSAATTALQLGGMPELGRQEGGWPQALRGQLSVKPDDGQTNIKTGAVVTDPQGQRYRLVYTNPPHRDHSRSFFDIPQEVMIASVIGGLAFSAILAWYLTNPIRRMRIGFAHLAQGDFATRLGPAVGRRRDEIADLAHDFDQMAVRLEELVKARDRLLASVSHELRTPLARIQLAIGLARQDPAKLETTLQRIDREAARLDDMVGELLTLSKMESHAPRTEEYFDIAEMVQTVVEDGKFEAAPAGVSVVMELDPPHDRAEWICPGSGKLISHAVENIVRNAIRFSQKGQCVTVRLVATPDHSFEFSVSDEGPGVPPDALGTMFQPFVQGKGGDGEGFGLGLAIAQRAILAHGGKIAARNRVPHGLTVSATLPAAAPQAAA